MRAKRVDVIVVYKVDRLTRSLADFAKLVELFDAHGVSFVSVPQSFNTTTSMGRLTLNVLWSFAQFEREVTGERIRDKIAASKKRGIWMGGVVPLGYRVQDRALHIVEDHAVLVRDLFRRYLEAGTVVGLQAILDKENVRLPIRIDGKGKSIGGGLISRGHLYKILSNPIHVGRLSHKKQVHAGQHAAIIDQTTWDRVQSTLAAHGHRRKTARQDSEALLAGKLFDDRGHAMSPSHTTKGGKRWRYYVSQALLQGRKADAGSAARVPAPEIEKQVAEAIGNRIDIHANGADHAANLRAAIGRVTISRTTITIQVTDAIAGKSRDRTLTVGWATPSQTRRREDPRGRRFSNNWARSRDPVACHGQRTRPSSRHRHRPRSPIRRDASMTPFPVPGNEILRPETLGYFSRYGAVKRAKWPTQTAQAGANPRECGAIVNGGNAHTFSKTYWWS